MIEEKKLILATKSFVTEFREKSWVYLFSTIFTQLALRDILHILTMVVNFIFQSNHALTLICCILDLGIFANNMLLAKN